jgi:hypothetical protein
MKVALYCLHRTVHNPALAGKDDPSISQGLWSILPAGPKTTDFEQPSQRFESIFAARGVPARAKFLSSPKFLTLL